MSYVVNLIKELAFGEVAGASEVYPNQLAQKTISISKAKVVSILGLDISEDEIVKTLARQNIKAEIKEDEIVVFVPKERLDLQMMEKTSLREWIVYMDMKKYYHNH